MLAKSLLATILVLGLTLNCSAEDQTTTKPTELSLLKSYAGVWDAEIEVWTGGPKSPSIKFNGVETNRLYGAHWLASDFDSEFEGQTIKVHSIVGYDRDQKQLVGTVIDHGPYAATMTGVYDAKMKTVTWTTKAKDSNGKPMIQKTVVTQINDTERILVLEVPGEKKGDFVKFMQIKFSKKK